MARIRSIKPEFATDGNIRRLSDTTALFFILLWNHCDDYGYFTLDTWEIALKTARWRSQDIMRLLKALHGAGMVRLSTGHGVGMVRSWSHQRIDKPRPSKWKDMEIQWDTEDHSKNDPRPFHARIGEDRIGEDSSFGTVENKKKKQRVSKADAAPKVAVQEFKFSVGSTLSFEDIPMGPTLASMNPPPAQVNPSTGTEKDPSRVQENGVVIQKSEIAISGPETKVATKKKRERFDALTREKMAAFVKAYCDAYKPKYGCNPQSLSDKAVMGRLGAWIEGLSADRAVNLVQIYMQVDYRPVNDACHDLWSFFRNLNRIGVALDTGQNSGGVDWAKVFS